MCASECVLWVGGDVSVTGREIESETAARNFGIAINFRCLLLTNCEIWDRILMAMKYFITEIAPPEMLSTVSVTRMSKKLFNSFTYHRAWRLASTFLCSCQFQVIIKVVGVLEAVTRWCLTFSKTAHDVRPQLSQVDAKFSKNVPRDKNGFRFSMSRLKF